MSIRTRLLLALPLALSLLGSPAIAAGQPPLLVELFTSQGCSSCPPADRYLGDLAVRPNVIALSYSVDYWDYLGWKDTLASHENTERQAAYGRALGTRGVYTPQMVIEGRFDAVGSDRSRVEAALERLAAQAQPRLGLSFAMQDGHVLLRLPESAMRDDATIWLVAYDAALDVAIGRGENLGRTVTYSNVVREIRNLGLYRGMAIEIALDYEDMERHGRSGCVAIVQQGSHGPVIGAAMLAYDRYPKDLAARTAK